MSWTEDRIPADLVLGVSQYKEKYASGRPNDVPSMESRLVHFVSLMDGHLDDLNFRYSRKLPEMNLLFCKGLHTVRHVVRDLSLADIHSLDEQHDIPRLASFLAESTKLTSIKIAGFLYRTRTSRSLSTLLDALARNPARSLRKLSLRTCFDRTIESAVEIGALVDALCRLVSLRELDVSECSPRLVQAICEGLMHHLHLEKLRIRVGPERMDRPLLMGALLASLPNLRMFDCNEETASPENSSIELVALKELHIGEGDAVPLLRRTPNLEKCTARVQRGQVGDFAAALLDLEHLDFLQILYDHSQFLFQVLDCPQLKCLAVENLPSDDRWLETFLRRHVQLESLFINSPMRDDEVRNMLELVEANQKLQHLEFDFDFDSDNVSDTTADVFRRVLRAGNIKMLGIPSESTLNAIVAEFLNDNQCALKHLRIESIDSDVSGLLEAVRHNSSVTSLFLEFEDAADENWDSFLDLIHGNTVLTEVKVDLWEDDDCCPLLDVDKFASALQENNTLTKIICTRFGWAEAWPQLNFVCRLFCRRNQIRQMVEQHQIPEAHWSVIMESLAPNPSAMFLAIKSVPRMTR